METGRYRRPYEYIRLSPVNSRPKKRYRSKMVESGGSLEVRIAGLVDGEKKN